MWCTSVHSTHPPPSSTHWYTHTLVYVIPVIAMLTWGESGWKPRHKHLEINMIVFRMALNTVNHCVVAHSFTQPWWGNLYPLTRPASSHALYWQGVGGDLYLSTSWQPVAAATGCVERTTVLLLNSYAEGRMQDVVHFLCDSWDTGTINKANQVCGLSTVLRQETADCAQCYSIYLYF